MMDVSYALLLTATLMLVIWYFWFFEYKRLRVDTTRQRLFKIRDDFFQQAVDGKIDFNDPLYGMTRTTLNGAIRFTHKITAWQVIGVMLLANCRDEPEHISEYKESWAKAFSDVESETAKKTVLKVHYQMHIALFHHLIESSSFLRVFAMVMATLFYVFKYKNIDKAVTSPRVRSEWSVIDAEANSVGQRMFVS